MKPTTLGTNMPLLRHLDGVKGKKSSSDADPEGLLDRMKMSRSWAAWPTAFKEEVVKVKSLRLMKSDHKQRLKKSFEVVLLGVTIFGAEGSYTQIAIPGINRREDWGFEDLGLLMIILAVLVIFDLIKNVGPNFVRRLCAGEEIQDMKVKILHKNVLILEKIHDDEGTPLGKKLASLGYSIQFPRGTCGRLEPRNDLMLMGIEVERHHSLKFPW
eukprot:s4_g20.t1